LPRNDTVDGASVRVMDVKFLPLRRHALGRKLRSTAPGLMDLATASERAARTSAADFGVPTPDAASSFGGFTSKSGTIIIRVLVPLCFRGSCERVPGCIANFGSGAPGGKVSDGTSSREPRTLARLERRPNRREIAARFQGIAAMFHGCSPKPPPRAANPTLGCGQPCQLQVVFEQLVTRIC
jgi:hypothetical protein